MKVIDAATPGNAPKPSMFLHGLTGGGKSHWSESGGVPLVILAEAKAQSVLLKINPKAIGLVPESLADLDFLMEYLGNPDKLAAKGIDRIVLDSFTELTQALPRWLREAVSGPTGTLVKLELSEYGNLRDYALAIVKAIQLTGYPSVIIGRSVSKRVGLADSIRPDGAGKSVDELPGKLLPTAEARFDSELGYVIDTTPADHSQRCGLPWVPAVYKGSCLEYLQIVEGGGQAAGGYDKPADPVVLHQSQATAPPLPPVETTAAKPKATRLKPAGPTSADLPEVPPPGANDPEWVALIVRLAEVTTTRPERERRDQTAAWGRAYLANPDKAKGDLAELVEAYVRLAALNPAPDPETDPEGYKKAFADVLTTLQAEKRAKDSAPAPVTPAATFAAEVAVGPGRAKPEDINELLALCRDLKVDSEALWQWAQKKGEARANADGSKDWLTISAEFVTRIYPQFKDPQKRVPVISWLHKTYNAVPF